MVAVRVALRAGRDLRGADGSLAEMAPDRPNVLLVVLDTARADSVGSGHDTAFAQLTRRGREYSRAVAPAPWTLPSHASLFSGLRPGLHGVTGASVLTTTGVHSPRQRIEELADHWLPMDLKRRGYATFAASANPWVGEAVGLTQGFDTVFEAWRHAPLPKLSDPLSGTSRSGLAAKIHAAEVYARRTMGIGDAGAATSLDAFDRFRTGLDGGAPYFAFFNVMEPHAPYAPPRGHDALELRRRPAAIKAVRRWNADRMLAYCMGRQEILPDELDLLRELYRGEISYTDAWLARLFEGLDRRGHLEDTLVIVTADHGENLGEHHLLSHVMSMHQTLLHVPLAISGPGVPAGSVSAPVGLTSIRDTVLAAADGEWLDPAGTGPVIAEYESASAQVSGARPIDQRVGDITPQLRERLRARWTAVYDGAWKLVSSTNGEEHLHDLEADPEEANDAATTEPQVMERLRALLPAAADSDGLDPDQRIHDVLDAEITSHLEGLGYL
jgi:arylsulfatase A-like enzyme